MNNHEFEIEKKQNKNWNLYLFELCISLSGNNNINYKDYFPNSYQSWIIELSNKRLIYDGRDDILLFEIREQDDWKIKNVRDKSELAYTFLQNHLQTIS